ncbi:MAG: preprotein translocase subunit SecG [Bdellovibrionota bacterium]
MLTVVTIVHVIFCLLLIALVLLQDPKSAGTGGVFGGGGSNSLLGATGAVTFLTRLTRYSAIIFGITSLVLSLLSKPNTSSVIDAIPASAAPMQSAPVGTTVPLEQNPAAADPKQAGTEAAPAQGSNAVPAKDIRATAPQQEPAKK